MFTGLIESVGRVVRNEIRQLMIQGDFEGIQPGESLAINGVCLTVLPSAGPHWVFDVSEETLSVTTLATLKPDEKVNLERAMSAQTRFGGHYVTGHVDTTVLIESVKKQDEFIEMTVTGFDRGMARYLIPKGSVTLDGVSLTINTVTKESFTVMLVPHTLSKTTLRQKKAGDVLNIEFDYLARLIAHQIEHRLTEGSNA